MLFQFHGSRAKDKVVVTDANVRYRNINIKVLAVSIDVVNESASGASHSRWFSD